MTTPTWKASGPPSRAKPLALAPSPPAPQPASVIFESLEGRTAPGAGLSTVLRRRRFAACAVALFLTALSRHAGAAPLFSIDDVAVVEGAAGTTVNAIFTVELSPAAAGTTTVAFN